mgnify:FL=1
MKLLATCFTLIVLVTSCSSKKKLLSKSIENSSEQLHTTMIYNAFTRGFFQEILITKNNVTEFKDYEKLNPINSELDSVNWENCLRLLDQINLENLANLKSPTNRRQFDGAAFAKLTIIRNEDTIQSNSFDHKQPPSELKPLVEYILSIKGK